MITFRPIERPSWWYEPDPDPYTDLELEMAWDDYTEKFGEEPQHNSKKWETYFEKWLEWYREDH